MFKTGLAFRALSRNATSTLAPRVEGLATQKTVFQSTTSGSPKPKTAVVMLNMGGPPTLDHVGPFLENLFSDPMIINLGKMQAFGRWAASKRVPKIVKQYAAIGGGSPIGKWTNYQGEEMSKLLDKMSPETAPHKAYTMFRYAPPMTAEVLEQMKADGVTRAIAFSQYPMYSCTTTGASLTHLWSECSRLGLDKEFKWSVIDRWNDDPGFIKAVAQRIRTALEPLSPEHREKAVIVFSAHSLPMKVVAKADPYYAEVAHTVQLVMKELNYSNQYQLAWQSKVGFLPWLVPSTEHTLNSIAKLTDTVVMVPIAFTSDHIETLYEIDIEYKDVAEKAGIKHFLRAPSLNDEPLLIQAQADLVKKHMDGGNKPSVQYKLKCLDCINPLCRTVLNDVCEEKKMNASQ